MVDEIRAVEESILRQATRAISGREPAKTLTHAKERFLMSKYVDGYVVPVPKDKLEDYRRISSAAGKVFARMERSSTSSVSRRT